MPRNEDGERELVVGNKQLLIIAFVLMIVIGVVFSMGYIVGRANSGSDTPAPVTQQAANQPAGHPTAAGAAATPVAESTPDASLAPGDAKVSTPETSSTMPVESVTPAGGTPTATPAPVVTPRPAVQPPRVTRTPPPAAVPQPGQTYLQVAAVKKPQAEMLVEVLKEKGFRALTSPVAPGSELYRALVGPLADASDRARVKAQLEKAGFKPIPKTL